ncbi:MAG: helix-turn-helix transcriptional regulator, partial [Alphaproteobacteria bacterium]
IFVSGDGRLKSNTESGNGALSAAIQAAVSTVNAEAGDAGTLLAVLRKSGGQDFLLDVSPLKDSLNELGEKFMGALVLVVDPENRKVISTCGIDLLFGLSKAEANVCDLLVEGRSTEDMAEIRDVSIETIRSQVKSVLMKTNSSNRSDVLRKAISLNLPIDQSDEDDS